VLWESTTKISSTHAIEARQRGIFSASFLIGTMTETGTDVDEAAECEDKALMESLARTKHAARISRRDHIFRHIMGDDGTRSDDRPRADRHPRQDKGARSDKRILADGDFRNDKRERRIGEVVAAGAQVRFLRDHGARPNFNFPEAVGVRAIAETGAIIQRQVPGNRDPGSLMNEGRAMDFGVEYA